MELHQVLLEAVMLPEDFPAELAAVGLAIVGEVLPVVVVVVVVLFVEAACPAVVVVVVESVGLDVKVGHPRFVPAAVGREVCRTVEDLLAFRAPVLHVDNHAAPGRKIIQLRSHSLTWVTRS